MLPMSKNGRLAGPTATAYNTNLGVIVRVLKGARFQGLEGQIVARENTWSPVVRFDTGAVEVIQADRMQITREEPCVKTYVSGVFKPSLEKAIEAVAQYETPVFQVVITEITYRHMLRDAQMLESSGLNIPASMLLSGTDVVYCRPKWCSSNGELPYGNAFFVTGEKLEPVIELDLRATSLGDRQVETVSAYVSRKSYRIDKTDFQEKALERKRQAQWNI
jgi:hypothetical protein